MLTTFNSKYIHTALALYSIAAFCRAGGRDIKVLEYTLDTPPQTALSDIFRERPAVVGIAVYIWNRTLSLALAAMIKRVLPEAAVVLGGPEVYHDMERVFFLCPETDFIVQGEGEETFNELLREREKGGDGRGVPGAAWKDADGTLRREGGARTLMDLSLLKFPYDLTGGAFSGRILYY
ncbi:MAG: cobalamin B12-binding domain-containing protein, partial [Acidaminococcales bacterium]|nr:cobalamin B12-binding domain-containing protein [Acidaminococcales bacterium]